MVTMNKEEISAFDQALREDYVFALCKMNSETGIYDLLGITVEEQFVREFLQKHILDVIRVEIFVWDKLTGPIKLVHSLEEFEDFMP